MDTVIVNKATLQKLIDYMIDDELRNYEECLDMEWPTKTLENHAYFLIKNLQKSINGESNHGA
jgi:hypothetical protein